MNWPPAFSAAMCSGAFPDHFVAKVGRPEDGVEHHLEIVGCGWIAVKVQAPSWLQDSAQLHEAGRHHDEIGEHVIRTKEVLHRRDRLSDVRRRASVDQFGELLLGVL